MRLFYLFFFHLLDPALQHTQRALWMCLGWCSVSVFCINERTVVVFPSRRGQMLLLFFSLLLLFLRRSTHTHSHTHTCTHALSLSCTQSFSVWALTLLCQMADLIAGCCVSLCTLNSQLCGSVGPLIISAHTTQLTVLWTFEAQSVILWCTIRCV